MLLRYSVHGADRSSQRRVMELTPTRTASDSTRRLLLLRLLVVAIVLDIPLAGSGAASSMLSFGGQDRAGTIMPASAGQPPSSDQEVSALAARGAPGKCTKRKHAKRRKQCRKKHAHARAGPNGGQPSPVPLSSAVLLAAGDIAACSSNGDEATAALLDDLSGTVATLGDNVYESGTASEFTNCYGPSWGRHKSRTRPAVGSHDYHTSGAPGYFGYFGAAATPLDPDCRVSCRGYYSYDLET